MKEERDGFLSRWSRLKRGADAERPPAGPTVAAPEPDQPTLPEGKSLEELIAELPSIEDLVPGQSLGAFMQPWVPTALRNAALQRMWLLDPAISGYVDPALDYAYDYNTLGAAPGFGPMEASPEAVREVHEMFDRALGRGPDAPSEPESADGENVKDAGEAASSSAIAQQPGEGKPERKGPKPEAMTSPLPIAVRRDSAPEDGAPPVEKPPTTLERPQFRRHGRALPT